MKRNRIVVTAILTIVVIFAASMAISAYTAAQIQGFATVANTIQKAHGIIYNMELTTRNEVTAYRADVVVDKQIVTVYYNAKTGKLIEKLEPVNMDPDEETLYQKNEFMVKPLASGVQPYANMPFIQKDPSIKSRDAKTLAVNAVGGGKVSRIRQDFKDNTQIYEIRVKFEDKNYSVEIDANRGTVLKNKVSRS